MFSKNLSFLFQKKLIKRLFNSNICLILPYKTIAKNMTDKKTHIINGYVMRLFTNRKFHRVIHQEMMLSQREALQEAIVNMISPNSILIRSVIEAGIKNGSFKKVDSLLVIASIIGTINQVLLSKKFCNKMLNKEDGYVPYDDPKFSKRVSDYLKALMHSYLLKK